MKTSIPVNDGGLAIDLPPMPPVAALDRAGRYERMGILTQRSQVYSELSWADSYDVLTYGMDINCYHKQPRRAIVGMQVKCKFRYLPLGKVKCEVRYLREIHSKVYLLHMKGVVKKALVGSMNFVYSDMTECMVLVENRHQLKGLEEMFNELWALADKFKP